MRRTQLWAPTSTLLLLLAACASAGSTTPRAPAQAPTAAQPSSASLSDALVGGSVNSDTVAVAVVHVRAARQAEYEEWLREVIVPASVRARQRFPSVAAYWAGLQFFGPAQRTDDSTVTYVYVIPIPHTPAEPGRSTKGGFRALLEDAGLPPAEVNRQIATERTMSRSGEVYMLVRRRLAPTP